MHYTIISMYNLSLHPVKSLQHPHLSHHCIRIPSFHLARFPRLCCGGCSIPSCRRTASSCLSIMVNPYSLHKPEQSHKGKEERFQTHHHKILHILLYAPRKISLQHLDRSIRCRLVHHPTARHCQTHREVQFRHLRHGDDCKARQRWISLRCNLLVIFPDRDALSHKTEE
jgi:hypothetical protein